MKNLEEAFCEAVFNMPSYADVSQINKDFANSWFRLGWSMAMQEIATELAAMQKKLQRPTIKKEEACREKLEE